jgi:hypothetical protein
VGGQTLVESPVKYLARLCPLPRIDWPVRRVAPEPAHARVPRCRSATPEGRDVVVRHQSRGECREADGRAGKQRRPVRPPGRAPPDSHQMRARSMIEAAGPNGAEPEGRARPWDFRVNQV